MTAAAAPPVPPNAATLPRWVPWVFVPLLTLPMHPYWLDFEQVRRSLLLVLVGAVLLWRPALRRATTVDHWLLAFLGLAAAGTMLNAESLNWWEAGHRFAHLLAVGLLLRLPPPERGSWLPPIATTLLAVAGFGLLQRAGVAEIGGFGTIAEPVSTLGNLNVAAEVVAIAIAASGLLLATNPRLALPAIALGCAYLVVNGSRGPWWLALPAAIGWLLLPVPGRQVPRVPLLLALALGHGLGLLVDRASPTIVRPEPAAEAQPFVAQQRLASVQVRLEIADSCVRMAQDAKAFGHGLGQFPVQYPRYRSQAEIEASTYGRSFAALPRTAHNDWLELLVETGSLSLATLLLACWQLVRGSWPDRHRLAPFLALTVAMLTRAPLGNAPAAALALLGTAPDATATRRRPFGLRLLGAMLLLAGIPALVANQHFTTWQRYRATGSVVAPSAAELASLQAASDWAPFDSRYLQEIAHVLLDAGRFDDAQRTAARAVALAPHDPTLLLLLAEASARKNDLVVAERVGKEALRLDPGNPEVRVLLSTIWLQGGLVDDAVRVVYEHLHPKLRDGLPSHFAALTELAQRRNDDAATARCTAESAFLAAVAATATTTPTDLRAATAQIKAVNQAFAAAGMRAHDVRWRVLSALHALDLDAKDVAEQAGQGLEPTAAPAWQLALLRARLPRLAALPTWQAWLQAQGP